MIKLYLDVETTGFSPQRHGVVEISAIPKIDGEMREPFTQVIKPFPTDEIDPAAIEYHGVDYTKGIDPKEALDRFIEFLEENRDDVRERYQFTGFNVNFDRRHLTAFMVKCGWEQAAFDAWFSSKEYDVDVMKIAKKAIPKAEIGSYKQVVVADFLGVETKTGLTKAMADIDVTERIENILLKALEQ